MTLDGPITRAVSGTVSSNAARLRHVAWAAGIALLLALTQVLQPLDWVVWTFQARASERPASGEIVFLELDPGTSDPALPSKRRDLAQVLNLLLTAGAEKAYVDLVFDRRSAQSADAELADAASAWGGNLAFVNRIDIAAGGSRTETLSTKFITRESPIVFAPNSSKWPNTLYELPDGYDTSLGLKPTLAADLADHKASTTFFEVDYAFSRHSIPTITTSGFLALDRKEQAKFVHGKRVVLSTKVGATAEDMNVPTQHAAPPSYVSIYGAETLKAGGMPLAGALPVTAAVAFLIALIGGIGKARWRYTAYSGVVLGLTAALVAANNFGVRIELASSFFLVAFYAIIRLRVRWRDRAADLDPDTGLPTLRALARQLETKGSIGGHVVVAKLHSYENILKTLNKAQRATYIQKLCERLRIGDSKLTVYVDGQHLAWLIEEDEEAKLVDHLEGLRAIFAAPVPVDQHSIDVGITFGAAKIKSGSRERCLAAALAASEETTEAFDPVKVASDAASDDSLWDLSLRARIDAAMEAGEVFCVYQPKMNLGTRTPIGVEALVRWDDPERGSIPPLHFVMQCEKAGRIEYLTRYVLQSACSAANLLHFRGHRITMSVNISATLLSDMRIVGIVRNVLQATGLDPNYLVLEITETSRIRDLQVARTVMKALKALGTSLSMDDFGVGAANFEALQALPFDEIKIDRQFVSRALTSPKARAITASIVSLGADARISVVAEGAETEADLRMLSEMGCRHVQGYAFARPMPLTNLLTYMESDQPGESSVII